MRFRSSLRKELVQLRRDPVGLALAVLVPALIVVLYRWVGKEPLDVPATAPGSTPLALVLCLAVWLPALTLASGAVTRERETGTLERLRTTPFDPGIFTAAKVTVLGLLAALEAAVVWAVARALVAEELGGGKGVETLASLALLGVAASALALATSSLLRSAAQVASVTSFLTLGSLLFSGFFRPLDRMGVVGDVVQFFPFSLAYEAVNGAIGGDAPSPWIWVWSAVGAAAFALVTWWAIWRRPRTARPAPTRA